MLETGQILKEGREQQGLSIQEVALNTKINPRIVKAIESGDTDNLPPKSFLRGFVKTYAEYLKLDVSTVLTSFQKEMGSTLHQPSNTPAETVSATSHFSFTKTITTKTIIVIGIVALITIILMIRQLVEKYEKDRETPTIPTTVTEVKPKVKKEDSKALLVKKEPTAEEKEKEKKSKEPVATTPLENPEPPAQPKVEVVAKNNSDKNDSDKKTPKEVTTEKPAPKKETKATVSTNGPHELIVEALDTVTIQFNIDNESQKTVNLRPDETHIIKAKSKINLTVSDGGMTNIIHNGKDRGVPGVLGKPHTIRFN